MSHLDNWTKAGRAGEGDEQVAGELEACGGEAGGVAEERVTHTFQKFSRRKMKVHIFDEKNWTIGQIGPPTRVSC